jgi:hypothetical protein
MARKKSTRRRRPAQSTPQLSEHAEKRIETERRRLNKAAAVLVGAELTAECCREMELVSDAINVARDLITQSLDALDIVELRRRTRDA